MDLPILLAQAHPWLQDLFQVLSYAVPFVAVLFYLQRHLDSRLERLQQNFQHDFAGLVTDARRTLEGKVDRANDRPFPQPLPASEIQAMMDALRQQIMQAVQALQNDLRQCNTKESMLANWMQVIQCILQGPADEQSSLTLLRKRYLSLQPAKLLSQQAATQRENCDPESTQSLTCSQRCKWSWLHLLIRVARTGR